MRNGKLLHYASLKPTSNSVGTTRRSQFSSKSHPNKPQPPVSQKIKASGNEQFDNTTKLDAIKEPFAVLLRGKARLFLEGNPIVYSGAIQEIRGSPEAGDLILVTDHHGNFIGKGFYNPHSQYRVRMLTYFNDRPINFFTNSLLEIFNARIRKALRLRREVLQLPNPLTDAFRLINGEGDRLSGCIIDVYHNHIIVQSSAYWVEKHRSVLIEALHSTLEGDASSLIPRPIKIIWRQSSSRLTQDGYQVLDEDTISSKDSTDQSESALFTIQENGVLYQISPSLDQKTGFYCDQRENRHLLQSLVQGQRVLDVYCYTGGFALNAALFGRPKSVAAIDSSAQAIARAQANYQLNQIHRRKNTSFDPIPITFLQGDAIEKMQQLKQSQEEYDVIICDPPKLAPTRHSLAKAKTKYRQINQLAMSLINRQQGGYLFTFTCSAAMTQSQEFLVMLQDCAQSVNRFITVLKVVGASSDHPVALSYQEGQYLTGVLLYIH